MSAGDWLVGLVTLLYIGAAIAYAHDRQWPNVIVFVGYAIANIGVIWMAVGGEPHEQRPAHESAKASSYYTDNE